MIETTLSFVAVYTRAKARLVWRWLTLEKVSKKQGRQGHGGIYDRGQRTIGVLILKQVLSFPKITTTDLGELHSKTRHLHHYLQIALI